MAMAMAAPPHEMHVVDNIDNLSVEKYFDSSKAFEFVKQLYNLLKADRLCFLSGSFVIEDPHLRLFNSLIDVSSKELSNLDLTRNNLLTKTHGVFLRNSVFEKKRITSNKANPYKLDMKFREDYCKIKAKVIQRSGFKKTVLLQYQRVIAKEEYKLQYLCDDCCFKKNTDDRAECCTELYCENNKETKRVILFYPFRIYNKLRPDDDKTYIFFKL